MRRGVLAARCHLVEEPVLDDLAEHPVQDLCGDLAGVGRRLTQLVVRLLLRALHKFVLLNGRQAVSRIRDVYPGSRLCFLYIPDPGSKRNLIADPQNMTKVFLTQKNATKLLENRCGMFIVYVFRTLDPRSRIGVFSWRLYTCGKFFCDQFGPNKDLT